MPTLQVKIPMLAKGLTKDQPKAKVSNKPDGGAMALGGSNIYKPPSKQEMHESAIHDEVRQSMRKWVAGDITHDKHKETIRRAKKALKQVSSVGLGVRKSKNDFTGGKAD